MRRDDPPDWAVYWRYWPSSSAETSTPILWFDLCVPRTDEICEAFKHPSSPSWTKQTNLKKWSCSAWRLRGYDPGWLGWCSVAQSWLEFRKQEATSKKRSWSVCDHIRLNTACILGLLQHTLVYAYCYVICPSLNKTDTLRLTLGQKLASTVN